MERFKQFYINEERSYLGHRVGDVLTSMQDLQNDMANLGTRQLARMAEAIVNQIRKILHSRWTPKYQHQLHDLQKVGVAIQKTIEEKGDLKEILPAAVQALSDLSGKLGVKINDLDAPEGVEDTGDPVNPQDFQATGPMPSFKKQPPQPNGPGVPQAGQPPMQGGPQTPMG